jgi:hypothetical protein
MVMVAAIVMGAAIRPRLLFVKGYRSSRDTGQITGFHGAGITR